MNILVFIIVFIVVFAILIFAYKKISHLVFKKRQFTSDKFEDILENKNYDKALSYLKKMLARTRNKSKLSEIHEEIGNLYFNKGSYANAIIEYRSSIKNGGETLERKLALAKSLYKIANKEDALTEYISLIKEYSNEKIIYFEIGIIYFENAQYSIAYDYFSKTENIDKTFMENLKYKGVSASFIYKDDEAISILSSISKTKYTDTLLKYGLARAYMNKKDYSTAIEYYKEALPNLLYKDSILYEMALCYTSLENYTNAIESLEKALRLRPKGKELLLTIKYVLAECYEKTKAINKAIELFENILFLDENYKDVSEKLNKYQNIRYSDTILNFFQSSTDEFLEKSINMVSNMLLYPYSYQYTKEDSIVIFSRENITPNSPTKMIYIRKSPKPIQIEEIVSIFEYNKKSNIMKSAIITYAMASPEVIRHATISHIEIIGLKKIESLLQNKVSSSSIEFNIDQSDEELPF